MNAACFFVALFSMIVSVDAQQINIVTTAVPFLRISPDARSGGMGDAGIATSPDANSGFWNLAKTPFAKTPTAIAVTYTPWLKDIAQDVYMASLSGYHQLDDQQAFSATLRYFNLGQIQFVDYSGSPLQTSRPREFALDLGYSRKLTSSIAIGVALRYINSSLANGSFNGVNYKAGNAVAADLSFYNDNTDETGAGFAWGVAITNLGSKIGYTDNVQSKDFIPANLGAGLAYNWVFQETSKFTLALDANKLLVPSFPTLSGDPADSIENNKAIDDYYNSSVFGSWTKSFSNNAYTFSAGAEYTYNNQFSARIGYFFEPKDQGNRKYFTAGVGLNYNIFGFNFSYLAPSGSGVTRNPLSNTLRFGITFDMSGETQQ